jgi:hypothetical protein
MLPEECMVGEWKIENVLEGTGFVGWEPCIFLQGLCKFTNLSDVIL